MLTLTLDELRGIEARVQAAMASADYDGLDVVGHGEVTVVLRLEGAEGAFACKRLPTFPALERLDAYRGTLSLYLDQLRAAGLTVADTEFCHWALPSGRHAAYCVQPAFPAERVCSRLLRSEDRGWAQDFFERFLDRVAAVVTPRLGLDAQASNWVDLDGDLVFIDVTTPFLRDEAGRELLDVGLYLSSLPWLVRVPVRLSVSGWVFEKYYSLRGVALDFLGNLHKERLSHLVAPFIEQVNARVEQPLAEAEVAAYYARDARTWTLIQRLRRADRMWQSRVRRRVYPYLLPPAAER